jgi:4-amino-4-deoxy-L-arabinose transferase-like glycosyltransferase
MQTEKGNKMTAFNTVHSLRLFGVLAPLSVMIVGPAFFIIRVLQPGLIPPALAILLFSYAAIAAMVAFWVHADRNSKDVTLWDIAGAFTMMGCTAAILSEPDQVALLFEQLFEGRSDTPR